MRAGVRLTRRSVLPLKPMNPLIKPNIEIRAIETLSIFCLKYLFIRHWDVEEFFGAQPVYIFNWINRQILARGRGIDVVVAYGGAYRGGFEDVVNVLVVVPGLEGGRGEDVWTGDARGGPKEAGGWWHFGGLWGFKIRISVDRYGLVCEGDLEILRIVRTTVLKVLKF